MGGMRIGKDLAKHSTSTWGASVTVGKEEEEYAETLPPRKQHIVGGGQRQETGQGVEEMARRRGCGDVGRWD